MSTTPQSFSIQNQCDMIHEYATNHDIRVVRTYVDEGKSGLALKGRDGLQRLIADVQSSDCDFNVVLVLDVSRWGRFQDADESAHYEYLCRQAGIKVIYCAEQFSNDETSLSTVLKSIKRAMAAEYSRELSVKVFTAQCKFIGLGLKQGGCAGYGLRRLAVGPDGVAKRVLEYGDRKGVLVDRVVYVPGPPAEISIVKKIYSWYLDDRQTETGIAATLNKAGVRGQYDRAWTAWMVHSILTNEKYIGNLIFNRTTAKLKRGTFHNPPSLWVRRDAAFTGLVSSETFEAAQTERRRRATRPSDQDLLEKLKALYKAHGLVTAQLLSEHLNSAAPKLYASRFGTLVDAYELAGISYPRRELYSRTKRTLNVLQKQLTAQIIDVVRQAGGVAKRGKAQRTILINGKLTLRLVVARRRQEAGGLIRWRIKTETTTLVDFVLVAKVDETNAAVDCYYLIPSQEMPNGYFTIKDEDRDDDNAYYRKDLNSVFGLTAGSG